MQSVGCAWCFTHRNGLAVLTDHTAKMAASVPISSYHKD